MSTVMMEIPESFAHSFGKTPDEVIHNAKLELAVGMYRQGRWSTLKAAQFAGMNRWEFMDVLQARKVEAPYTKEMLEQDIAYGLGRM